MTIAVRSRPTYGSDTSFLDDSRNAYRIMRNPVLASPNLKLLVSMLRGKLFSCLPRRTAQITRNIKICSEMQLLSWGIPFQLEKSAALVAIHRLRSRRKEGEQWDCPGNKVRFHREQSAGSSCPNRFPRDYCTRNRCAAACACTSAEPGSPIAKTYSCSSSPAAIQ